MSEGLSAGHTQKKALSCLCRSKKLFKWKFFFFLKPQSDMPGLALISLLSALEQRVW